jgi:hypothetical protein
MSTIPSISSNSSSYFFDDKKLRSAAYVVGAVAIGALGCIHGTGLVTAWIGGTSTIFLIRDIMLTVQDLRYSGLQDSSEKITHLAHRIFAYGIIYGVLLSGLCLTKTAEGSICLLKGLIWNEPYDYLNAFNYFAGIIGVWGPLSQFILNQSDRYFYNKPGERSSSNTVKQWIEAIVETCKSFAPGSTTPFSFNPIYRLIAVDSHYASLLPVEMREDFFKGYLSNLDDEQIQTLINRYPFILNVEFLEKNLSSQQFDRIVQPQLVVPFSLEIARIMEEQLKQVEKEVDKTLAPEAKEYYSTILLQFQNGIKAVESWSFRLPAIPSQKTAAFSQEITRLLEFFEQKGMASRIQLLRDQLSPVTDDLKTLLQSRAGFNETELKTLHTLFPYKNKGLNELFYERGLRTKADLKRFDILSGNSTPKDVRYQLRKFLNKPSLPTELTVPKPSRLNFINIKEIAHRIYVVANYIFYYGFTLSMLWMQYYYFPITTMLGLGYGMYRKERYHSLKKLSSWETVPDFTGQSFSDRCRFIWSRTLATLFALRFGAPSAFLTGIYLADTLRHYAGPQATHLKNRIYARIYGPSPENT